jgi:hypothetical protein
MIHATVDMTEKDGEVKSRNHTNDSAVNFIVAPTALQLTGGQEWDDLRVGMGGLDKRTPKQPDPPEGGDIMWGWTSITKVRTRRSARVYKLGTFQCIHSICLPYVHSHLHNHTHTHRLWRTT